MLVLSMNGTYGTRNRWFDKIAFFSLFIVVLVIAHFIVVLRSAIVLSEPIELNCAGLSVCIPAGNGWQSEKQWRYQRNTFALDSFFASGSGSVTAIVSCRYLLAATKAAPNELFEEKASAIVGSTIAKTGQIEMSDGADVPFTKGLQNGGVPTLHWAYIKSLPGGGQGSIMLFDIFFGTAQLPNNRRLDIEVYQTSGDTNLAEEIFKSVTESLTFTDNRLLNTGSKIVTEIKDKGLDSFLVFTKDGEDRENFFLIKDARGRTVGFTMEMLGTHFATPQIQKAGTQNGEVLGSAPEVRLSILAMSFYYIHGRYDQEQTAFFRSDNNLKEFVWRSSTSGPGGRSSAEVVLGENGIMTIREFGRIAKEKEYRIGPAAIPDVLGEFTFSQMLDSDRREILVDIIEADGKITPALVSRTNVAGEKAAYVFRVEPLDGRGFFEQVYLDDQRQISRRLLQQENAYTIERTVAENILREFPEQGSYILRRKDEILEQDQLQENSEW